MKNEKNLLDLVYDKSKNTYYDVTPELIVSSLKVNNDELYVENYDDLPPLYIAILDTGVLMNHPRLKDRVVKSVDFTGEGTEDFHGHGTITSLILLHESPKNVKIFNVKVLDKYKNGTDEEIASGIIWAVNNGSNLINMSISIERTTACDGTCVVCKAIRYAAEKDVTCLVTTPNDVSKPHCPAQSEYCISVGASY